MWKGTIRFDDISVPVKLYSAVEDRTVHFRLLHAEDEAPVQQRMINPRTGEPVPYEEIRRGLPVAEETIVVIRDEELESLEPEPSRDVEITRFVDPAEIKPRWYERPYHLGPDGDDEAYAALAKALADEDKEGVAQWVMRKKKYLGALRSDGEHLSIVTLRPAEEVVDIAGLRPAERRKPTENELKLARQLVESLEEPFDPAIYRDEYRERVLELVEAKAEGRKLPLKKAPRKKPTEVRLADALKESLHAARKRKKAG